MLSAGAMAVSAFTVAFLCSIVFAADAFTDNEMARTVSPAMTMFLIRQYFLTLPKELEEAAMVDGCTRIGAIRRIMMPLALPGIVATITYTFVLGWSNVIYPLAFITDESKKLVSIGFNSLVSGDMTPWNGVMAAAVLSALPVVLVFLFLQKYLVGGLAAGGVKS